MSILHPEGITVVQDRVDDDLPDLDDLVIVIGNTLTLPVTNQGWGPCPNCGQDHGLFYWWEGVQGGPLPQRFRMPTVWAVMHQGEPLATGQQMIGWPPLEAGATMTVRVTSGL